MIFSAMAKFLHRKNLYQCWYKYKFSNSKPGRNNFFAVRCRKIRIASLQTFNDSMETETFEYPRHCRGADAYQILADVFSLHPKGHEFAPAYDLQYTQIMFRKEIKFPVRMFVFNDRTGDLCQIPVAFTMVIKG